MIDFLTWISCCIPPVHLQLLQGILIDACLSPLCQGLQALQPLQQAANCQEEAPLAAGLQQHLVHQVLCRQGDSNTAFWGTDTIYFDSEELR